MARDASNPGDGTGSIPSVPFFFLRHGETDWNRRGVLQGAIDIPLNETGLAQAHAAAARFSGVAIATVVASPLSRARVTAEIAAAALGLPVEFEPAIAEVSWGNREGTPDGDTIDRWLDGDTPEGGEPVASFNARVAAGMTRALSRPGPVLVVAHGGVFRAVRTLLSLPPAARVENARPLFLSPDAGGWKIADVA
ncbi:MAG: histidine phosphatase family protein [Rhodospirillales bacterium]|nr:histidine phosphatase family protein [Rhodospirillales bacterium]